jgi:adenine phosphoribosyltransferase
LSEAAGGSELSEGSELSLQQRISELLRVVPDFPKPGILFQDITPVLADAGMLRGVVAGMAAPWRDAGVEYVAGIESRGFILAAPIAIALGAGFVPIRKPGKLPWKTVRRDYGLEYGADCLEMHVDGVPSGGRVLVVDDVLATGGTASAACALIESIGGQVVGCGFLLEIVALGGTRLLDGRVTERVLAV